MCGPAITSPKTAGTAAGLVTLGLAAASWVVVVRLMNGMDGMNAMNGIDGMKAMDGMGLGRVTGLGSFAFFVALWVSMMAAMMLPGAAPAVSRLTQGGGGARAATLFVGSYVAVWTLVGVVVSAVPAVYGPHGSLAAGVVVLAAGVYELTPLKRRFRRHCREGVNSGFEFGLYCIGSCAGLMAMLVALGVMSLTWMAVVTVLVAVQKYAPAKPAVDVPLALAILGLGALILLAPSSVPGFPAPM